VKPPPIETGKRALDAIERVVGDRRTATRVLMALWDAGFSVVLAEP
jgi:hypothetical protein